MARRKLSRAIWKGSWYYRKDSGTWRNKQTGEVKFGPPEITGKHVFGGPKKPKRRLSSKYNPI